MIEYRVGDYQRLFQVSSEAVTFFASEVFRQFYKTLEVLITSQGREWTCYMPNYVRDRLLLEGKMFYQDSGRVKQYQKDFKYFIIESSRYFESILAQEHLSKTDLEKAFNLAKQHFSLYHKTEFFYTDLIYQEFEILKDSKIEQNLDILAKVKMRGREHLNSLFFGKESYVAQLAQKIAKQYHILEDDINYYSIQEIMELFEGKTVRQSELAARKLAFVTIDRDQTIKYSGKKAKTFIEKFNASGLQTNELLGKIANQGKCQGVVKVISSEYYSDFSKLESIFEALPNQFILVAETTSPELLPACKKALAIVTNQGGMLSHAAIISRELGIPCLVGVSSATSALKDGMEVEVDAEKGVVKILKND